MALLRHSRFPATFALLGLCASSAVGCLDRPIEAIDVNITSSVHERLPRSRIGKIDLLLMIDNSASMADKQDILADAVPDLVKGLVAPPCIDATGKPAAADQQPKHVTDECPAGYDREFEPVLDIHIGIISSSLGSYGTSTCAVPPDGSNPSQDDAAHLVFRKDATKPDGADNTVPTYKGHGFLAWDPAQKQTPVGEKDVGEADGVSGLIPTLRDMVKGAGQRGCGYEAQMESWYRFLVDPEPYKTMKLNDKGQIVVEGVDEALLAQRAEFIRPSSLVAVVMLTDENDCSFKNGGDYYGLNASNKDRKLPRGRKVCQTNPDDPCCKSCAAPDGACGHDDTCDLSIDDPTETDLSNVRCFDQKRRFGIDFLYPLDRYVTGLESAKVPNRKGELVDNPLFPSVAASGDVNARTPESGLVFLAGIVGVPWQDIARRNAKGEPDLLNGLDGNNLPVGGFKSAQELTYKDASGKTAWEQILGNPATHEPPGDALMIESRKPREGVNPATGAAVAGVDASSATANPVNGHEWITPTSVAGDLEYACTFALPHPRTDCAATGKCDCEKDSNNPLCQDDKGAYVDTQFRAKAYPGVRQLGVLEGLGDQGIVASVCPAQLTADRKDYGYRPAIGAIVDRLKQKLSGECLHRALNPDPTGQVQCLILEGRKTDPGQCFCDANHVAARQSIQVGHEPAQAEAASEDVSRAAGYNCFCEIKQASGEDLEACENDTSRSPVTSSGADADGWCYLEASAAHPLGDPSLLSSCAPTEKHKIRFVGAGEQLPDSTLFITCSGG